MKENRLCRYNLVESLNILNIWLRLYVCKVWKIVDAHLFIFKLLLRHEFYFLYLLLPSHQGLGTKERCKWYTNDIAMSFDKRRLDLFVIRKREEITLVKVAWQNKIYLNYSTYSWKYVGISAVFDHLQYFSTSDFHSNV